MANGKPRIQNDLVNWLTYHSPFPDQIPLYTNVREAALAFARVVSDNTPAGHDQAEAIKKIREAVMWANSAIACRGK